MSALPEALAVVLAWVAVVFDERTRRVPNRLTFPGAAAGVVVNGGVALADHADLSRALGSSLGGALLLLLALGIASARGWLGWGDTKLGCAVGACVGLSLALRVLPCVALSGGLVAGVHALRRGEEGGRRLFPYASAIALGTTWAVAGRYLPALAVF